MHIKITFDKSSSSWEKDFEFNKLFTKSKVIYIMDCYRAYGYIYLNKIYELFGLKWNPYNDNTYWIWERDGELEISIIYDEKLGERIYIGILHNSQQKIGPLTTALSFYPRLEFSTQVTEKHVKLISEKFPGLKIWKNILKGGRT